MNWNEHFIKNYISLTYNDFFNKYDGAIDEHTTIGDLLLTIKNLQLESYFIDIGDEYKNSDKVYFLIESKSRPGYYENFFFERGARVGVVFHQNLESAIKLKLDRILNSLLFTAKDSGISNP